jgi:GxxExxY protein
MDFTRMMTQRYINQLSYKIIGCAFEVHRELGPGLLESIYEQAMLDEMRRQGLEMGHQVEVPVFYKNKDLGGNLRLDILVEDLVIIELKAVENVIPVHRAQLLSYLKLAQKPKGLLINFHCENIRSQMISLVGTAFASLPP